MFIPSGLFQLALALPDLKAKELQFRTTVDQAGMAYSIPDYGGVRTAAQQAQLVKWRDEAVAQGEPYYDVAPPDLTFHGVGAAFDVNLTKPSNPTDGDYATLAEIAVSVGLRPGYFFSKPDPYHFELDIPLETAKQMYQSHTTTVIETTGAVGGGALALLLVAGWLIFKGKGGA